MNSVDHELLIEISQDIISQIAPEELPLFKANSQAYFQNPDKALKGQTGKNDMLGFGGEEVVIFLTPIVLATLTDIVNFIVKEIKKSTKEQTTDLINSTVKNIFKKFHIKEDKPKTKVDPLTPEQIDSARFFL
jgi:hypothetical protein